MTLTHSIAGAYLNSKVIFDKKTGILVGINTQLLTDIIVMFKMHNNTPIYKNWCSADTKLVLKPLCEFSEVDAIELAKIEDKGVIYSRNCKVATIQYKPINTEKGSKVYNRVERYIGNSPAGFTAFASGPSSYSIEQIDYLRRKGYDCGYGDIPSLIDAGIAIR